MLCFAKGEGVLAALVVGIDEVKVVALLVHMPGVNLDAHEIPVQL